MSTLGKEGSEQWAYSILRDIFWGIKNYSGPRWWQSTDGTEEWWSDKRWKAEEWVSGREGQVERLMNGINPFLAGCYPSCRSGQEVQPNSVSRCRGSSHCSYHRSFCLRWKGNDGQHSFLTENYWLFSVLYITLKHIGTLLTGSVQLY